MTDKMRKKIQKITLQDLIYQCYLTNSDSAMTRGQSCSKQCLSGMPICLRVVHRSADLFYLQDLAQVLPLHKSCMIRDMKGVPCSVMISLAIPTRLKNITSSLAIPFEVIVLREIASGQQVAQSRITRIYWCPLAYFTRGPIRSIAILSKGTLHHWGHQGQAS